MVTPQTCQTETEIRRVLEDHLQELVREKQEVRVDRGDGFLVQGVVESYIAKGDPEHDEEDHDALYVETGCLNGYVFRIFEIKTLEILPTQRATPPLALKQMLEMEHAAGLKI